MSRGTSKKKNTDHTFKYVVCFIIFFVVGVGMGIVGTKYFLDSKTEEDGEPPKVVINEITDNPDYKSTIDTLYGFMNSNIFFYSSKGLNVSNMDNANKLILVYDYLVNNTTYPTQKLNLLNNSNKLCTYNFLADISNNQYLDNCTITVISGDDFVNAYKKLFNDSNITVGAPGFFASSTKQCIWNGNNYLCGNIRSRNGITGSLNAKFTITKVIKEENNDISIYDKGYLVDTRSTVVRPNDGYDNYYLHTSDSKDYYYELKSADNVTFKHTFKLASDNSYYYYSSEVVPKEE